MKRWDEALTSVFHPEQILSEQRPLQSVWLIHCHLTNLRPSCGTERLIQHGQCSQEIMNDPPEEHGHKARENTFTHL